MHSKLYKDVGRCVPDLSMGMWEAAGCPKRLRGAQVSGLQVRKCHRAVVPLGPNRGG